MITTQGLLVSQNAPTVGQLTVNTTAAQLTTINNQYGVIAPKPTNTGVIYIGSSNAVTSSNGFPLTVPMIVTQDNMNRIWAIGTAASDTICFYAST